MSDEGRRWVELAATLGRAGSRLVAAEYAALRDDFAEAARRAGKGVLLIGLAGVVLFWAVGVLVLSSIEIVALWAPRWVAALSVLGGLGLAALVLGLWGRWKLRTTKGPGVILGGRSRDLAEWWQRDVAGDSDDSDEAPGGRRDRE